ncbi:MAG: ComEC/Rec2 family competence protein [Bacteroidales bacterium]|nr:ComEC/Rec2 family competence protein [Bacteroidales bacterium]
MLIPYLLGAVFISSHLRLAWSLMLFGAWGLILFGFIGKKMATSWTVRWIPGVSIWCFWLSLGAFSSGYEHKKAAFPAEEDQQIAALIKMETVPAEKRKTRQFWASVLNSTGKEWKGKHLQCYIARDERSKTLEMGDILMVRMKPQKLKSPTDSRVFNYAGWLQNKGICATAYISSCSWILQSKAFAWNLRVAAERMRAAFLTRFRDAGISGEEYSLVSALTLGSVHLLTSETKQQFSVSGVSHILSVSGLHVAVVYAVLELLLSFFNRFEKLKVIKQLLIMLLLWFYAFMTGLSPSVVRSALMFSMLALGSCLHRKAQTINTVLFSAFVLLLWRPSFLFDLSFELSYCAVISIVVVHGRLTDLWHSSSKVAVYFWKMICLSAVAQLGTAPLTIYHFHQFPNYFLLNNLVAVPASGLIIYLAFAFLFLSGVPYLGVCLTWALNGSLHWFQWFVKTTSELPFALTTDIEIQKAEVLLLYALMASFFIWFFLKRRKWIFVVLVCVLSLQGLVLSHYFSGQKRSSLCEMSANSYICEKRNR